MTTTPIRMAGHAFLCDGAIAEHANCSSNKYEFGGPSGTFRFGAASFSTSLQLWVLVHLEETEASHSPQMKEHGENGGGQKGIFWGGARAGYGRSVSLCFIRGCEVSFGAWLALFSSCLASCRCFCWQSIGFVFRVFWPCTTTFARSIVSLICLLVPVYRVLRRAMLRWWWWWSRLGGCVSVFLSWPA